jgi:hypothetical protein
LTISAAGSQTINRPVMPRCTIHCAFDWDRDPARRTLFLRSPASKSRTMCLPARCTRMIFFPSNVVAIFAAGDFSGCFRDPIQTDSIVSPLTRLSNPRTMVSTSGSSGIESGYRRAKGRGRIRSLEVRGSKLEAGFTHLCNLTSTLGPPDCSPAPQFGMLERTHRLPPNIPVSSHFSRYGKPVCATPGAIQ